MISSSATATGLPRRGSIAGRTGRDNTGFSTSSGRLQAGRDIWHRSGVSRQTPPSSAILPNGGLTVTSATRCWTTRFRAAVAEEPLFHLVNATSHKACSLLIVSREPVAGLGWQLADLTSRLRSVNLVRLERPDDALLRRLLEKYFADRQLVVAGQVLDYMVGRMERSFQAVQTIAAAMDRRSLATRRDLTLPLAREIMTEFAEGVHSRQPPLPTGPSEEEKS